MAADPNKIVREITQWIEMNEIFERMFCSAPLAEQCPRAVAVIVIMIAGEQQIGVGGFCSDHKDMAAAAFEVANMGVKKGG